ncbi:sugar phosphate isomerase/epimerase [Mucilaginibacter sp. CSA2-8R]|uniref:sugar phosphate isomerase/epimerase family protein n=1 Tax=Mucilaginibacter sp. CSA2-8R TaxID=3141542 RepID=UPI00315DCF3D
MQVNFFCPRWGFENMPWPKFIDRVKQAGYQGVEWFPYSEDINPQEVTALLKSNNLQLAVVMTVLGDYKTTDAYIELLQTQLKAHIEHCQPAFVTAQTGREYFNQEQIQQCIDCCAQVSKAANVPVYQETHRNKWAYAAHVVLPVLQKNEKLCITFDVSHWFCVSESYLEDQQPVVNLAIERAAHIHARVGHTQGPQVTDPAKPQYAKALAEHLAIWDKWIERKRNDGANYCTITPEFGPPPYFPQIDDTPTWQEQWRINCWMKDLLHERYNLNNNP